MSITKEDLEQHRIWNLPGGKDGKRIERAGATLSGANLYRADLYRADLGDGIRLLEGRSVIQIGFDHGWELILFNTDKGIHVVCGCRGPWTVEKIKSHWKSHEDEQRRKIVLPALKHALAIAKIQGWK